jgi:hypothetical protein
VGLAPAAAGVTRALPRRWLGYFTESL